MTEKPVCDYPGCGEVGEIISMTISRRLPSSNRKEGLLV